MKSWSVALLAEGVDRNNKLCFYKNNFTKSPSSRRAWIEINKEKNMNVYGIVALLAEGVDRNNEKGEKVLTLDQSPSSRRAWIEIFFDAVASGRR